jgi:putative transcriptional regulator
MIQCRLWELMAQKGRQERHRITYDHILEATRISKNTLTHLANNRAAGVGISVIDRLCSYFQCQPGDLLVYVLDQADPSPGGDRSPLDRPAAARRGPYRRASPRI